MLQGISLHPAQPVGMGISLGDCGRGVGMCQDPRNSLSMWGRLKDGAKDLEQEGISAWERGRLRAGEP